MPFFKQDAVEIVFEDRPLIRITESNGVVTTFELRQRQLPNLAKQAIAAWQQMQDTP